MTRGPIIILALLAFSACSERKTENVALDINNASPADIEALPPDESSEATANELENGADNADVADLNSSENAY